MCIHWPSGITGCQVYKGEVVFTLVGKSEIPGSDVGVPIVVRIDPLERTITRGTLDEHGVMYGLLSLP